jgi:hypothetical protein
MASTRANVGPHFFLGRKHMHVDKNPSLITMASGARLLGVTYQGARDLLLRGKLDGGRDRDGHWFIRTRSVHGYIRQRTAAKLRALA